ncbi:MAG: DUF5667 domain-containing protein [Patescibacteria group bacterium]|nr:DUF5667 domain-containing protein [Patescibacteria group bacterium]MCL5431931.1 DUF5667 domain-containing protein [Patescibacteria group bacterium]
MVKKFLVAILVLYLGGLLAARPAVAVDYALPYPGMLPDSPVYFLKVFRDQVTLFLVHDPKEKAFYELMLSDKRLAAGEMLIDKGEKTLGAQTVVQAQDYFSAAVDAAPQTKDAQDLWSKLTIATSKHSEVIAALTLKVSGKDSDVLAVADRENRNSSNRVKEIFLRLAIPAK